MLFESYNEQLFNINVTEETVLPVIIIFDHVGLLDASPIKLYVTENLVSEYEIPKFIVPNTSLLIVMDVFVCDIAAHCS